MGFRLFGIFCLFLLHFFKISFIYFVKSKRLLMTFKNPFIPREIIKKSWKPLKIHGTLNKSLSIMSYQQLSKLLQVGGLCFLYARSHLSVGVLGVLIHSWSRWGTLLVWFFILPLYFSKFLQASKSFVSHFWLALYSLSCHLNMPSERWRVFGKIAWSVEQFYKDTWNKKEDDACLVLWYSAEKASLVIATRIFLK